MSLGIYLTFTDESSEVVSFYEDVFSIKCNDLMKYKDMPPDPNFPIGEDLADLVMNASLVVHGVRIMFSDLKGTGSSVIEGNNFSFIVELEDEEQLEKEFNLLSEGGKVITPLGETFWTSKYGQLVDKYGISWQFSLG